jgi:uncharacterized membrane protein
MSAVLLGVIASLGWGLHDLFIRFVSRSLGSLQSVMAVFIFGAGALLAAMWLRGETLHLAPGNFWILALAGIAYALAFVWLFQAFAIGPVSLVSPIVGAYPVLVMVWAVMNGAQPTALDWLAVAGIVTGVALVGRFATETPLDPGIKPAGTRKWALIYSGLSCFGFAVALFAGQRAAQNGGELSVNLISRIWSMAVIAPLCMVERGSFAGVKKWWPVLMLMGALDAMALTAIVSAGQMDGAQFATVVGSTFGAVTVVLAVIFFKERINLPQLFGMVMILGGVVMLSGRY